VGGVKDQQLARYSGSSIPSAPLSVVNDFNYPLVANIQCYIYNIIRTFIIIIHIIIISAVYRPDPARG
jgi:hypothetical protein